MTKHPSRLDYIEFPELADDLGNLRYDKLADFLNLLSEKIDKDGKADALRKRPMLSRFLTQASTSISGAAKVCEPHMHHHNDYN